MEQRNLLIAAIIVLVLVAIVSGAIFYFTKIVSNRQAASTTDNTVAVFSPNPTSNPFFASTQPVSSANPKVGNTSSTTKTPSTTKAPVAVQNPVSNSPANANLKTYSANGFSFDYPKTWGILTCKSNQNFELDPANSQDTLNYNCGFALKPVTVLVGAGVCPSQRVTLGRNVFTKSVVTKSDGVTTYTWCTTSGPKIQITHRVSPNGGRAISTQNYAAQVEQMLSTYRFSTGS